MRTLMIAALVAAFLFLAAPHAPADELPLGAIGRLELAERHLCTGFVVRSAERIVSGSYYEGQQVQYETWVVTAGHCVAESETFAFRPIGGRPTLSGGVVIGMSASAEHDLAVLRFWSPTPAPALEPLFSKRIEIGDPLMLVGYGGRALLARVDPFVGYEEETGDLMVGGYASRGASGGPVLIPGTRSVVGILTKATLSPPPGMHHWQAYCALKGCATKPPYYATTITKLQGLVRWR